MSQDAASAKEILKKQLYRALVAEGGRAKGSSWFATNRFASPDALLTPSFYAKGAHLSEYPEEGVMPLGPEIAPPSS